MSRAPFRQVDVTRALRAAKAAGIKVSRFEIDAAGKITVFDADAPRPEPTVTSAGRSALEQWKAEQQRLEKEAAHKWRAEAAAKSNAKRH